jgi:hypothetical protein
MHKKGETLNFFYGKTGGVIVQQNLDGTTFVQLDLKPRPFVILGG